MITADNEPTCPETRKHLIGVEALYEVGEDNEIGAGVILCAIIGDMTYIFEVQYLVDIFVDETVPALDGTVTEYPGTYYVAGYGICEEIDYFRVENCRFPTKKEFLLYNSVPTV